MRPRFALPLILVLVVLTAGCVSDPAGSPTPTGTPTETVESPSETTVPDPATPLPNRTVEFPDGPKERPERPETLTEDSVGEFVTAHEYQFVYNKLWYSEYSEVSLDCELVSVSERDGWFEAEVSCTGYSNTGGETSGTETATVVHADWFTQQFVYFVDENSLIRERADGE